MKNLLAVGFSGIALAVSASEWYVDPTVPDDSHGGTSPNAVLGDAAAGSTFRFAYEPGESDTGCAYLRSFGPKKGLVLIVR